MSVLASKPNVDRLKRQLVQQAVQENLELIHGRARLASSARLRRRQLLTRWAFPALVLPAVLGLGAYLLLGGRPEVSALSREAVPTELGSALYAPVVVPDIRPRPETLEAAPADEATPSAELEAALKRPLDAQVLPLAVRHIVLDPGHGGDNLGTHLQTGLNEKDITLDIALRLRERLLEAGYRVTLTRDSDVFVSLKDRGRIANEAQGDVFLSIHVNWLEDGGRSRGIETYYLGTTDDPRLSRLAAEENVDSGYSMGEMKHLVERIYGAVRGGKSQAFASALQAALFRSLRTVSTDLDNRGVKTAPFVVLLETEMPAVLAEVSCLSNRQDAELLAKPLYRQYIADALSLGILAYARESSSVPGSLQASRF
jgi:N-acetylmuramoyl-L-alanine amidase